MFLIIFLLLIVDFITLFVLSFVYRKWVDNMGVSDKIKALLKMKGRKMNELADYLGIGRQSLSNKFSRGSFSAEDLIKIADFLGCALAFEIDDAQKIILDKSDIRN